MSRKKDIFLALSLTIFIISFAVVFTVFFKQLYYFDIDYLKISYQNLSKEVIQHNYDILIQYQSIFYKGTLQLPDFIMSQNGRIHFEEVKRIFEIIQISMVMSGLISFYMIYQNHKVKEYRYLKLTTYLSLGIPTVLGMLASIDFDKAFIIFHKIFFRNDFWLFDYRVDPVIEILPESFFMHCFMLIIFIVIALSIVCYLIYKKKEKEILGH